MTTVASALATSSRRIARWFGVGSRRTVCSVATAGTSSARTKSRTYSPSSPPQIPYSCWIETTSTQSLEGAGGVSVVGALVPPDPVMDLERVGGAVLGVEQGDDLAATGGRGERSWVNVAMPQRRGG